MDNMTNIKENAISRQDITTKDLFVLINKFHDDIPLEKAQALVDAFYDTTVTYVCFAEVMPKINLNYRGNFKQYAITVLNEFIETKRQDLRIKFKTLNILVNF